MSAFAIFVLVLTVIYVIYYSAIIMQDLYAKKDAPKTEQTQEAAAEDAAAEDAANAGAEEATAE
jgi:hypothetical protein